MATPEEIARQLAAQAVAADDPTGWFERVYAAAEAGETEVPWDRAAPNRLLVQWAADGAIAGGGRRAVVVGCGLGDDAEAVAATGRRVIAFDISQTAIDWCRRRFPASRVEYAQADLLEAPAAWREAFDLVVESQTVQAFPPANRRRVCAAIAGLVAPAGSLWVFQRLWEGEADPDGPPWPLRRSDLDHFLAAGLHEDRFELWERPGEPGVSRFAAEFRR